MALGPPGRTSSYWWRGTVCSQPPKEPASGLLAASWLHQAMARWLTGPAAVDPAVFAAALLLILAAAGLAVYLPARRAMRACSEPGAP